MASPSASFFDHFDTLEDPRLERCRRHKLCDIVFIAVCAVISGANDFVGMEKFGHTCRAWLEKYLELPNGIPSHDTFGRVFAALHAEHLIDCFLSWVATVHQVTAGEVINIDGKALRASLDRAEGQKPLHVVSAWAAANRLTLGQVTVDEKSNEITAIPRLLEMLALKGAIVTIDAMGCQKDIAATIRQGGADYVLAVKGNQEHLEEDIIQHFTRLDQGEGHRPRVSRLETEDHKHGRREDRYYEAVPVPRTLRNRAAWPDLRSLCRATRVWQENGQEKSEVRYFISSLGADARVLGEAIRGHWGIENGLHWVLDMYFGEDRSRARIENAAANMALLRRWVLSLLRQDETVSGSI